MNAGSTSGILAWLCALLLLALPVVGVLNGWFARDRWPVTQLAVHAEFEHVSAAAVRSAVRPMLGHGFFAIRLDAVRAAVARLPWVERVEVRKRWPDTLELTVYEQQPWARWNEGQLINRRGEVFSVADGIDELGLPALSGPDEQLNQVLKFHALCLRELAGSGLELQALALSERGGWSMTLDSGARIELGRRAPRERLRRFLDVWPRIAVARGETPAAVDLRYENGFAVRWRTRESSPVGEPIPSLLALP